MIQKKRIVVFGGGNGTALTLTALKPHADVFDISAIVSMSDSGGSSGRLRERLNTLPPGDIMRAIIALSTHPYEGVLKEIFYTRRFENVGELSQHNLGNIFLVLAEQFSGSYINAVRALEQAVAACGHVYPATLEKTNLVGELESGQTVTGEHVLDRPEPNMTDRIRRVWLEPRQASACDEALEQIESADVLLFGPGSLYCSIVASLLPHGIFAAIERSHAQLVYLAGNRYEKEGERGPTVLSEFVRELEAYLPRKVDSIIFNGVILNDNQRAYYEKKKVSPVIYDRDQLSRYQVVDQSFEEEQGGLSSEKLGAILFQLLWK